MPVAERSAEALAELMFGAPDPFPLYDELRELGGGVHRFDPIDAYFVFRYADIERTNSDHEHFSSDIFWQSPSSHHNPDDPEHRRFVAFNSRLMVFKDPPAHTRLRNAVRAGFTPRAVARWREAVEQTTDELLDRVKSGEEIDLVRDFAYEVPVAIVAAILGVPADDRASLHRWSFSFGSTFDFNIQGEARDAAIRDSLLLIDYLSDLAEDRRRHPGDDLTSMIVNSEAHGEAVDPQDLVAQVFFLLSAGNETTANLVTNGLTLLLDHPEACRHLRDNPGQMPSAIEEMLRYDPPLHLTFRRATQDTTLGDTHIPADAIVYQVLPAANRDPRHFVRPKTFDIGRASNKHLAFNHGLHFCVGAPLARMESDVIFRKMLSRFPAIEPGSTPPVRRTSNVALRGWQSRPVVLHGA